MNLNGWDTAYAVSMDRINAALTEADALPKTFSFEQDGVSAKGTLADWAVVPGGSASLLHLQVRITAGTMSGGDDPHADLSGLLVVFEVNLKQVPTDGQNGIELRFDFEKVGRFGGPGGTGFVSVYAIEDPDKRLQLQQKVVLGAGLAAKLVAAGPSLAFALASVNLVPPDTDSSWLTPVALRCTTFQSQTAGLCFVICAVTSKRDVSDYPTTVDPRLLKGSGPAYFAISRTLFIANVLLPLMPSMFPKAKASNFGMSENGTHAKNIAGFKMHHVKSGAITYHPYCNEVKIGVDGDRIDLDVQGECSLKLGIRMKFDVSSRMKTKFDATDEDLKIEKDNHPSVSHKTHIPDGLRWPVLDGVVDTILKLVTTIVAGSVAGDIHRKTRHSSLAKNGPLPVTWPGLGSFTPSDGGLDDGFQMSGD